MQALIVENNVVVNIIEVEDLNVIPNLQAWYEGVRIGDILGGGSPDFIVEDIEALKSEKNLEINAKRVEHNMSFPFDGKLISSDTLSRSDIDGVATHILFTGNFPEGFTGLWKAVDNTYITMGSVEKFKQMHYSMTAQGMINFLKSEQLKQLLAIAETAEEVKTIDWDTE